MAKGYWLMMLCMVLFAGCKDEKDPFTTPGSVENPNWVVNVDNDMTSSMTAVVRVSFAQQEGTLAAFMGDACCGVAEYNAELGLYWLYISSANDQQPMTNDIQLRFYSPALKRIFLAEETFPFQVDSHLGTLSQPYTPTWKVAE